MENLISISSVILFFEQTPPGITVEVDISSNRLLFHGGEKYSLQLPPLELFCTSKACEGIRNFDSENILDLTNDKISLNFATFKCRNCQLCIKKYALQTVLRKGNKTLELIKFGEIPNFGAPTPNKLLALMGNERDYFFKGRRSENQGLGIAAFAYYRRVIENQKNKFLDELIKVANLLKSEPDMIQGLENAKNETQFSKAIGQIKNGIPQALLIQGHNPLLLLHTALSEGLHAQTDEKCLELATAIREILTELIERMALVTLSESSLKSAISRLSEIKK